MSLIPTVVYSYISWTFKGFISYITVCLVTLYMGIYCVVAAEALQNLHIPTAVQDVPVPRVRALTGGGGHWGGG